jgi:glutamine amidotransferase
MCRLYGFRSSHPRKIECELIRAQNSLLAQSRCDSSGEVHPDGWGLGCYDPDGNLSVARQPESAFAADGFRAAAGAAFSTNVIAHVRKATIGQVSAENTHPFHHRHWLFAHNGTLAGFAAFREALLAETPDAQRAAIRGNTDSEHLFHYFLGLREQTPDDPLDTVLRRGVLRVAGLAERHAPGAHVAFNCLLTDGRDTAGVRWGKPLWVVERPRVHPCEVCGGALHVGEIGSRDYRAVVVASERITATEDWRELPNHSLFRIGPRVDWHCTSL